MIDSQNAISPEDQAAIDRQVASWRKEIVRLQDLVDHASGDAAIRMDAGCQTGTHSAIRPYMTHKAQSPGEIPEIERGTIEHLVKSEIPHLLLGLAELDREDLDEVIVTDEFVTEIENALNQARDQLEAVMLARVIKTAREGK